MADSVPTSAVPLPPESALHPASVIGIDRIWLINLDRRSDRLERFMRSHPEMTGRLNRLPACDGKNLQLTPSVARLFAPNNFQWHKPTMGCALSHLALWQSLAAEKDDTTAWLILEDDAELDPAWVATVEKAFINDHVPADWNILYLGGVLPRHREFFERHVMPLNRSVARVRPDCRFGENPPGYFHFCAYAYLLNARGARRLLDLIKSWNGFWLQADFIAAYHTPDLSPPHPVYFLHPLRARSFQDTGEGYARPYAEGEAAARIDSDIWKEQDCFSAAEVAAVLDETRPLDLAQATRPDRSADQHAGAKRDTALPSLIGSSAPKAVDDIWLINLPRRADRLEKFKANHPDIADRVNVLPAYDGKKLRLTPKIARLFAPNDFGWSKATMGCSLSHLELWQKLADEPAEDARYLILEDDTRLSPEWLETLQEAFARQDVPADWDVLYLGGVLPHSESVFAQCKEQVSGKVFRVVPNDWFGQKPPNRYFHFGAYAYLLSKSGARKMLEFIRLQNGIWPQADYILSYVTPADYPVQISHYFLEPFLAHCYQDLESGYSKSYDDRSAPGRIDSDIWKESSSFDEAEAKALASLSDSYDIPGALAEARAQMEPLAHAAIAKLSLLHATRGRASQALAARELWLRAANHPERVEHIFAFDHDDESAQLLKSHPHVVQEEQGFSVGAWNLAASRCTGDILIQLSDDWLPPEGWDDLIAGRLDLSREEVLWISDGHRQDDLMCMAILTRRYYERHGLFDPSFRNVFSDNDFTIRAQRAGAVVDARDILVKHDHPFVKPGRGLDATYERGNQALEYVRAKAVYDAKHSSASLEDGAPAPMHSHAGARGPADVAVIRPDEVAAVTAGENKEACVAFCVDRNYFPFTGVAIKSLAENGGCGDLPVFIFSERFEEEDIVKFSQLESDARSGLYLVAWGEGGPSDLPSWRMSRSTYARLLLPKILAGYRRVLSLDSDILVLGDLRDALNMPMDDKCLAAVRDPVAARFCRMDLFRSGEKPYFNAGFMLIDTQKWMREEVTEKVIALAKNEDERERIAAFAEQCLLNYVLRGNFAKLGKEYNWLTFEPHKARREVHLLAPLPSASDLKKAKILHFAGQYKPWMRECSLDSIKELYFGIALRSPWNSFFTRQPSFSPGEAGNSGLPRPHANAGPASGASPAIITRSATPKLLADQKWPHGTDPVVTVFCVTYNHRDFIGEALDSFLMQKTDFPVRIFVHDDASSDGTSDIVRSYAVKYPEVMEIVVQKENQWSREGAKFWWSYLLGLPGQFVALCEGDDYWTSENKLQQQHDLLVQDDSLSMCFHETVVVGADKSPIKLFGDRPPKNCFDLSDILIDNFIHTSSVLFRRKSLPQVPDWFSSLPMADWPLFVVLAKHGGIGFVAEQMSAYRLHGGSYWLAKPPINQVKLICCFYEAMHSYFGGQPEVQQLIGNRMLNVCQSVGDYEQERGSHAEASLFHSLARHYALGGFNGDLTHVLRGRYC